MRGFAKIANSFKNADIKALIVLMLPIIFWQLPLLLPHALWFWGDMAFYFYPMTSLGMDQWRSGSVPLWTHLVQCGFPLLADGQGALLYPPNLLLHFILPTPIAHNLGIVIHTVLTSGLMYALIRTMGFDRWPGVIAGWLWVFAGPIATSIGSPALNGLTWWPLLFIFAEKMSCKTGFKIIALCGLVMGISWLGGFPQTTLYGIFGASAYLLFRSIMLHGKNVRLLTLSLCSWAVASIVGIGISAIQILPTLEMSSLSIRAGGNDFSFASQGSMLPTGIASFLLPNWTKLSEYWLAGQNLFIGFVCLAAVLLTVRKKMDPRTIFFWGLALFGIFISFGKFNPVYQYLYNWPGFHFLRVPARFLYLTMFCASVLSAAGFHRLFEHHCFGFSAAQKLINRLVVLLSISLVCLLGGSVAFYLGKPLFLKAAQTYVNRTMLGQAYKMQNASYYQNRINTMFTDIAAAINPLSFEYIVSVCIGLLSLAIIMYLVRHPQSMRFVKPVFFSLVGLNLLLLWHGPLKVNSRNDLTPPPLAKYMANQAGLFRLYCVTSQQDIQGGKLFYDRLDPDYNLLFNVPSTGVFGALGAKKYFDLLGPLGSVNLAFGVPPVTSPDVEKGKPILNLIGATYILSPTVLTISGIKKEAFNPPYLYKNETVCERAFVVPTAKVLSSPSAVLDSLRSLSFDPTQAVLLDKAPGETIDGGIASKANVTIYQDKLIKINAPGPGWLVVTNQFYPGWKAWVDGKETPIYCGDYVFQTLPIFAGNHSVEFRFESKAFNRGLLIAAVSLGIVLLLTILGIRKGAGNKNQVI